MWELETEILASQGSDSAPLSCGPGEGVQYRPRSELVCQGASGHWEKFSEETFESRRRKDVLAVESPTGRVRSWVALMGSGFLAPLLPRGGTLPGASQPPRIPPPYVTPSHQGEQTAPCLASWLPTLASPAD